MTVNKIYMKLILAFIVGAMTASYVAAQQTQQVQGPSQPIANPNYNWFNLDETADKTLGISTERAFKELLKNRKARTVVVAVIDAGIDTTHEDLRNVLWVNRKEKAGNKKDDDGNGYTDDVHGWNFIGGPSGNINHDTEEETRIVAQLEPIYQSKDRATLDEKSKKEYDLYLKAKSAYTVDLKKNQDQASELDRLYSFVKQSSDLVKSELKLTKIDSVSIKQYKGSDPRVGGAISMIQRMFQFGVQDIDAGLNDIAEGKKHFQNLVDYGLNLKYNPRTIVGDNYADLNETNYGNSDVTGPDALHGTHVAGIIGAIRDNNIGIKGIADHVELMSVRTVPDGDERDKDVANAIMYAVNNGAQIINMSFGKGFSPGKQAVDKAVKYAEEKGVFLVHAAGNESSNKDSVPNYPSRLLDDGKVASNWIEVGASSRSNNQNLVAPFSNYGKKTVDVFAPGVDILSTVPGPNKYKLESGTSMAAPVISGLAAVLMEYFPNLKPADLKKIIMESSVKYTTSVLKPGSKDLVSFSDLSVSGGVANLYRAVKMASNYPVSKSN